MFIFNIDTVYIDFKKQNKIVRNYDSITKNNFFCNFPS